MSLRKLAAPTVRANRLRSAETRPGMTGFYCCPITERNTTSRLNPLPSI